MRWVLGSGGVKVQPFSLFTLAWDGVRLKDSSHSKPLRFRASRTGLSGEPSSSGVASAISAVGAWMLGKRAIFPESLSDL